MSALDGDAGDEGPHLVQKPAHAAAGLAEARGRAEQVEVGRAGHRVTMLTIRPGRITTSLTVTPPVWRAYSGWPDMASAISSCSASAGTLSRKRVFPSI